MEGRGVSVYLVGLLLSVLLAAPTQAGSLFGDEWEKFFKERISFGGFVENTTGLAVGSDRFHFDTSNRFDMNRFTIQPEFNVNFAENFKLFISWKFVKEPRYNMEAKSRRQAVSPKPVEPLNNTYYDQYGPAPWEMVIDYNPIDTLNLRWGRQFISWGETDGIRLLDVINPQDGTFTPPAAPNLFNLDETRLPSWGLRTLYTVHPPTNTIFEFFALPGFDPAKERVDKIVGSNDTSDRTVKYGRWSAHPETRLTIGPNNAFGNLYANPIGPVPVVIPVTHRELPDAGDDWKIGARLTHNFGKLNVGLGYIWGFNPQASDMVFKAVGTSSCGPPACPPGGTLVRLNLLNDRTSIYATHFNYPVDEVLSIPINTAVRGELAFYPNKPYNIARFPGTNGLRASFDPAHPNGIVEKNTLRYSLGFDRTTFIPFLQDDPWRAFRLSFQIFQSIIFDHEEGIHPFSTAEKIGRVTTNLTFRISTGYFGDTILPDVFVAYDPDGYWAANPAVTYTPSWNERIKLSLIGALYGGHNKFKSFGFFAEKDSIFLKMRYQF